MLKMYVTDPFYGVEIWTLYKKEYINKLQTGSRDVSLEKNETDELDRKN